MAYDDHDPSADLTELLCRQRDNELAMRDLHHGDPEPVAPVYGEMWVDDTNSIVKTRDESVWRNAWPLGTAYRMTRFATGKTSLGIYVETGFAPLSVSVHLLVFAARVINKQHDMSLTFEADDTSPPQPYTDRLLAGNDWGILENFNQTSTGYLRCTFLSTGFVVSHFPNIVGTSGDHQPLERDVLLVRGWEAWA